jgi:hypothetical protein
MGRVWAGNDVRGTLSNVCLRFGQNAASLSKQKGLSRYLESLIHPSLAPCPQNCGGYRIHTSLKFFIQQRFLL